MAHNKAFAVLGLCVLLSGCWEKPLPVLPQGEQVVSGVLRAAELSLVRRGTHVLSQDETDAFFVESKKINLRTFEGKEVTLKGTVEFNIDPYDLPVLVVQNVESSGESMKQWQVPSLKLSFEAPIEWNGKAVGSAFTMTADDAVPVLSLSSEKLPEGSFAEFAEEKADGIPVVVAQKRGIRIIDDVTGGQTLYIDRGADLLVIAFLPSVENGETERAAFLSVLRSMKFAGEGTPPPKQTGTGTMVGVPCGGTAGILCPTGQYCQVTDLETNVGRCVRY